MTAARLRLVFLNREPSGRARRESHFRYDTGYEFSFDVIAVEVQLDWPIRTPTQFDDVALLDSDQLHIGGEMAALDAPHECQVVCPRAPDGKNRAQGQLK